MDMSSLGGPSPRYPDSLALNVVASDGITLIKPRPDVTREAFAAAFKGMNAAGVPPTGGQFGDTVAVAVPATDSPSAPADQAGTLSNFKQAALGMIMYANDYDDVLPYPQDSKAAYVVTEPYVKNRKVMATSNPSGGIMKFNPALGGVTMTQVPSPADTPLYYDSEAWPDGSRCVAFLDGHAKIVSADDWRAVAQSLKMRFRRTAKPLPAKLGQTWDRVGRR